MHRTIVCYPGKSTTTAEGARGPTGRQRRVNSITTRPPGLSTKCQAPLRRPQMPASRQTSPTEEPARASVCESPPQVPSHVTLAHTRQPPLTQPGWTQASGLLSPSQGRWASVGATSPLTVRGTVAQCHAIKQNGTQVNSVAPGSQREGAVEAAPLAIGRRGVLRGLGAYGTAAAWCNVPEQQLSRDTCLCCRPGHGKGSSTGKQAGATAGGLRKETCRRACSGCTGPG